MWSVRQLLELPKRVEGKPQRVAKSSVVQRACNIQLATDEDVGGKFSAFVRVPTNLPEQFSLGVCYVVEGSRPSVLIRVNGEHSDHKNPDGDIVSGAHIHLPGPSQMDAEITPGTWQHGPRWATQIPQPSLIEAWQVLSAQAGIMNSPEVEAYLNRIYSDLAQMALFDEL